jgi:hypothetical protein
MSDESARQSFNVQVDAWVSRSVAGGVSTFHDLLSSLPGVFPSHALASVRRLRQAKRIRSGLASRIEQQARGRPVIQAPMRDLLLPPHPLDFEWRFNRVTAKELLALASMLSGVGHRTLLLGTPTLATLASKAVNRSGYIYVGEDNAITRQVAELSARTPGAVEVRLCGAGALRAGEADVVILDPPWYFDFLRPMLSAALFACRTGGHILVSLPPIGTNSRAADERPRIFQLIARLSLNVVSISDAAVTYDTPYFEANSLAADRITNVPRDWRHGDLFLLQKAHRSCGFELADSVRKRQWHETVIGRMRIFVATKALRNDSEEAELGTIIPGDVLRSVSRRDPLRRRAKVWTSGNRIFTANRPDLVHLGALQAAHGKLPVGIENKLTAAECDTVSRLSYHLSELAVIEEAEEQSGRFEEAACYRNRLTSSSGNSRATSRITPSGRTT